MRLSIGMACSEERAFPYWPLYDMQRAATALSQRSDLNMLALAVLGTRNKPAHGSYLRLQHEPLFRLTLTFKGGPILAHRGPQRSVVHHSPQSTARHGPVLCRPAQSARSLAPLRPLILQYPWLAHDSMPSSGGSPRLPSPHTGGLCRKVCELYKILKC